MPVTRTLIQRELYRFFLTPVAYVFMVLFLILSGAVTFFLGDLLGNNRADLSAFFQFVPWLFLLFIPSLTMGLWSEERGRGTLELLLTLPLSTHQANRAKYYSVLIFLAITLILTFLLILTVFYLGNPDAGVLFSGYIGAFLVGAQFAAMGLFCSSLTKNQVVAFVSSCALCLFFLIMGTPVVLGFFGSWAPDVVMDILSRLSLISAFENWTRGVFYLGDVVGVLVISTLFVFLAGVMIEKKEKGGNITMMGKIRHPLSEGASGRFFPSIALCVVSCLAVLLGVHLTVGKSWFLDITEEGLYTLSQGTRTIVSSLPEPVTVRLYYSRALGQQAPQYGVFADRILELLKAYQDLSHGQLKVHIYNPTPFSDAEDEAIRIGLKGIPAPTGEKLYLGMVATAGGADRQIIPFFPVERERYLEYDLTQALYRLTTPAQKTLAILSTIPIMGQANPFSGKRGQGPWMIMDQLKTFFTLNPIATTVTSIPEKTDILMLVQPQALGKDTLKAVDRYVSSGGRLLLFMDPFVETQGQLPAASGDVSPDLARLLATWGLRFDGNHFLADAALGRRVTGDVGGYERELTYYGWLSVPKDRMQADDTVMADLDTLTLASAGSLTAIPTPGLRQTVLLTSSDQSASMDLSYIRPTPDVVRLLKDFAPTKTPFPLAMKIQGLVNRAFPESQPVTDTKNKKQPLFPQSPKTVVIEKEGSSADAVGLPRQETVKTSNRAATIIAVGDVDMLYDAFWLQK
ncbi:MAG: Gldg family protein, partial [Alphaproteobacteria bacterium]